MYLITTHLPARFTIISSHRHTPNHLLDQQPHPLVCSHYSSFSTFSYPNLSSHITTAPLLPSPPQLTIPLLLPLVLLPHKVLEVEGREAVKARDEEAEEEEAEVVAADAAAAAATRGMLLLKLIGTL